MDREESSDEQDVSDELARDHAVLTQAEQEWSRRGPLLESYGYRLRPRYRPGWTPSWRDGNDDLLRCEDFYRIPRSFLIDAERIEDGKLVYIKAVSTGNDEIKIATMLSSPPLNSDIRNHCVPILDIIEDDNDPDVSLIVMPFLRLMDDPPFDTVDDVVDFVDQMLEGLVFIHEQGVAHRDCSRKNIMMDASTLYPQGFHPIRDTLLSDVSTDAPHLSRSAARVMYYYVDFGISVRIPPEVTPKLVTGRLGRDRDPPELRVKRAASGGTPTQKPYDPFKLDVFILGNTIKKEIYENYSNLEFLQPLFSTMTAREPQSRPTAAEAQEFWRTIRDNMSRLHRISRLRGRDEVWAQTAFLDIFSFVRIGVWISTGMYERIVGMLSMARRSTLG
ncbi:uncharacterized protein PHACADRAFT_154503 [Phanerochaete carnosa HHB-10118-sp]|uniref:Protein kinase domain-containing protein n=1 Tax=Phanerochaete carnosa (strain HHB-10118-sp) TaxID=650164 RepID=K5VSY2_PHACS|nr:uncharacterized protein PHACADRAFT_154503 [Phanerochaete carnosa HHB-10118-sp]EKM49870.1 hypothetical protein PHACADRAFT_154503 [Phanerochaete carnosa HHB-10118-sp]